MEIIRIEKRPINPKTPSNLAKFLITIRSNGMLKCLATQIQLSKVENPKEAVLFCKAYVDT